MTDAPADVASLLAEWGLPAGAQVAAAERGTNNRTIIVSAADRRFVLRISQNLTVAQVRAEHRLLALLRGAELPFAVPEPRLTATGEELVETGAGPATLTAWLPGVRPRLAGEIALRRFGRTVGLLSRALALAPAWDAPHVWRTTVNMHQDVADVGELCRDLRAAGADLGLTVLLEDLAAQARDPSASGLPAQVVHGDVGASNLLADERTGEITAVLDFELASLTARVQDFVAALSLSGALDGRAWQQLTAAMAEGYVSAQELTAAEAAAVPGMLAERALGSVLWRAGRWRRGQADLTEVTDRLRRLANTRTWLAANSSELGDLLVRKQT